MIKVEEQGKWRENRMNYCSTTFKPIIIIELWIKERRESERTKNLVSILIQLKSDPLYINMFVYCFLLLTRIQHTSTQHASRWVYFTRSISLLFFSFPNKYLTTSFLPFQKDCLACLSSSSFFILFLGGGPSLFLRSVVNNLIKNERKRLERIVNEEKPKRNNFSKTALEYLLTNYCTAQVIFYDYSPFFLLCRPYSLTIFIITSVVSTFDCFFSVLVYSFTNTNILSVTEKIKLFALA